MEAKRKTKNRYQQNIHMYQKRLETAKSFATKIRLKSQIRNFKRAIARIESRDVIIKKGIKLVESFYDNEIRIIKTIPMIFRNESPIENLHYQARCLFFKYMVDNGINSGDLAIYFYRTKVDQIAMDRRKTRAYKSIRENIELKNKYKDFKTFISCSTTTPH